MLFVNNSYDTDIHRPVDVGLADKQTFGAPVVSFIGTYDAPRAQSVIHLASRGVPVRVWERLGEVARAAREPED